MKKYAATAGTSYRVTFGHELLAGLLGFSETAPLADEFRPFNERLQTAGTTRINQYVVVVRARADARVAEFNAEREIRSFSRALQVEEGGRRGPACRQIIPDGINPLLTPRRRDQARVLRNLIGRLASCTVPAAVSVATVWLPRLTAAAERFEATIDALDTANTGLDEAYRSELAARAEHSRAVDAVIGRVRGVFPEDRPRQDAVFPVVDSRAPRKEEETDDEPAPTAEPAPATP